ncbi:MAG: NrfD/PsrC family molybdoenzyme membrane anchor subunit [Raoultibacter sp.]
MKNHYWTWPIALYLFLGGLGGGILTLVALFEFGFGLGESFIFGVFLAVACLGVGCFFLVFELGQPLVFWRVFKSATAIIKWGAVLLSFAMIFGFIYFLSYMPWEWCAIFIGARTACLAVAGVTGACIMIYTGVLLSSLKAHAFWNTPALPVLFTVSALSTGCAALAVTVGLWPSAQDLWLVLLAHELVHSLDMILIVIELLVLMLYVLLLMGAGNVCSKEVARRWLTGRVAPAFWGGMVCCGLLIPFICYAIGGLLSALIAPVLVLSGGLLLRFLVIFADDRRLVPGEKAFYERLPKGDEAFLTAWKDKENLY